MLNNMKVNLLRKRTKKVNGPISRGVGEVEARAHVRRTTQYN